MTDRLPPAAAISWLSTEKVIRGSGLHEVASAMAVVNDIKRILVFIALSFFAENEFDCFAVISLGKREYIRPLHIE